MRFKKTFILILNKTQSARLDPALQLTSCGEVTRQPNDDGVALEVVDGRGVENTRSEGARAGGGELSGGLPLWLCGVSLKDQTGTGSQIRHENPFWSQ